MACNTVERLSSLTCDGILSHFGHVQNYLQTERNIRYLEMVVTVTKRENYQKDNDIPERNKDG